MNAESILSQLPQRVRPMADCGGGDAASAECGHGILSVECDYDAIPAVVRATCSAAFRAFVEWFEDYQRENTPMARVGSFRLLITGSVYLGVHNSDSDADLVFIVPSIKGLLGVQIVLDEQVGMPRYLRTQSGVGSVTVVESRVPVIKFTMADGGGSADVSFSIVPRETIVDADVTIAGLEELAMSPGWKDTESLRALLGVLGTRVMRIRAEATGALDTWRQAYVVVREMARSMGVLSGMCRLLCPIAVGAAVLCALERTPEGRRGDLCAVVVGALELLCPPPHPVTRRLRSVHVFDPFHEKAPDSKCSWKASLSSESRGDAFLASGVVPPALTDVLLSYRRSADQTIGARCLSVWFPTSVQTSPQCCTALITHSVSMPQYMSIHGALTACRRRLANGGGDCPPQRLFSGTGVLYGCALNVVTISPHPRQALVVLALAQLVNDISYDSRRTVVASLWPQLFPGPTPGSQVAYLALRRTNNGAVPDLRLDMLVQSRLLLAGADLADAVSISTYNPTAVSAAELDWVKDAVFSYPETIMPWPPAAQRMASPSSPRGDAEPST